MCTKFMIGKGGLLPNENIFTCVNNSGVKETHANFFKLR